MDHISYHHIGGAFPKEEHRISMVQVGVSFTMSPTDGSPSHLCVSAEYTDKLRQALTCALRDNWANIVVLPEISVPASLLAELMGLSRELVTSRDMEAGGCLVCLPLEHLPLPRFDDLIHDLAGLGGFVSGDSSFDGQVTSEHLLIAVAPADRPTAFVNVAILLVFGQSGLGSEGRYFLQPKRFPYPGERTPGIGRFAAGSRTYLLDIGGTRLMTCICYDFIAQPPGGGLFLADLVRKARSQDKDLHYLLVPQCNRAPLDYNFQRAVADLYLDDQVRSRKLRTVSPNVAHLPEQDTPSAAGHSWFVTCPFGNELPPLGIWERSLVSVLKDPSTQELVREAPSLGHHARRLRLAAEGEWLLHLSLPPAEHLAGRPAPNVPLVPHAGSIHEWREGQWRHRDAAAFTRDCQRAERLPGLMVLAELPEWVQENFGGQNTYSPSYTEFIGQEVHLPQSERDKALSLLAASHDVWIRGERACGKTVFGPNPPIRAGWSEKCVRREMWWV